MWGGRLGTNLVELGFLDLDDAVARARPPARLPAALARHFEQGRSASSSSGCPPSVAERYSCVPLLQLADSKLVVAGLDRIRSTQARLVEIIAGELGDRADAELVISVAAEQRMRYQLERVYRIPRGTRFLRSRGKTIPPFPQFEIAPATEDSDVEIELPDTLEVPVVVDPVIIEPRRARPVPAPEPELEPSPSPSRSPWSWCSTTSPHPSPALDDRSSLAILEDDLAVPAEAPEPITDEPSGRDRRRYVRTIADEPSTDSERDGRSGGSRSAAWRSASSAGGPARSARPTRAIRRGPDRDRVAELVVDGARSLRCPACDAAMLLVVARRRRDRLEGLLPLGPTPPEIASRSSSRASIPRAIEPRHDRALAGHRARARSIACC